MNIADKFKELRAGMTRKRVYGMMIGVLVVIALLVFYRCPLRLFMGIPCPGCGMTRAFWSLLHFRIGEAFHNHPLFPVVIVVAGYYFLEKWGKIRFSQKTKQCFLILFSILFVIVYLIRLWHGSDVVRFCPEEGVLYRFYQYAASWKK